MELLRRVGIALMTLALGAALGGWFVRQLTPQSLSHQDEMIMWQRTVFAPLPGVPSGVFHVSGRTPVIADVVVQPDGVVKSVEILEHPDARLASEVIRVVKTWRFKASRGPTEGKLTFYFTSQESTSVVDTPGRQLSDPQRPDAPMTSAGWALPSGTRAVDDPESRRLLKDTPGAVLLDVRDSKAYGEQHRPGAINIPLVELTRRAKDDLASAPLVLIDCSSNMTPECPLASWSVSRATAGRSRIVILLR